MLPFIHIFVILISLIICSQGSFSTTANSTSKINVLVYHNLPPDIHRLFNVTITFPYFHKISSVLLIYLVNKTQNTYNLMDNFTFSPGLQSRVITPYRSQFMLVPFCASNSSHKSIELHLDFNYTAQEKSLLIYYSFDYQPQLNKTSASLIYESVISCTFSADPHIDLWLGINEINEPAFVNGQNIWINCSSKSEHEPIWRTVTLEGLDSFDILKHLVSNNTNTSSVYTSATIKNHGRVIVCRSMNHFVTQKIKIYHHPFSVRTIPKMSSWSVIPYNVSHTCVGNGGYPPPVVSWEMRIGPLNASRFYTLMNDKKILKIHGTAPPGSKWIFDCSAKNSIPFSTFNGPVLTLFSNVPELSIERRKIVMIVVPIVVVIIILIISIIKGYCYKTQKKDKVFVSFFSKTNTSLSKNSEKFFIESQQNITSKDLSRNSSNSTYSIEAGIDHQWIYVMDPKLDTPVDVDSRHSQGMELSRLKDVKDATDCHFH